MTTSLPFPNHMPGRLLLLLLLAATALLAASAVAAEEPLALTIRQSRETAPGSGRYHAVESAATWQPSETAIVVCDMWNQHWCRGATARVVELAPRMNQVLNAARAKGVLIVHSPSDCMDFYRDAPQRQPVLAAAKVATARLIEGWCHLRPELEGELPIDDSDGGCDCTPTCPQGSPWTRQIADLKIQPVDVIGDDAQVFYLLRNRGIRNVIVMGVHANMCVLGRPFGIRQLVDQGMNVALMRDMTDAMYCSRQRPFVNHFSGNDLVVEHTERHWCPTLTSDDFTEAGEFRFAADDRPTIAFVAAEDEYDTARTLTQFAAERLRKDCRVALVYGSETERNDIPGLESLAGADVVVLSVRRRTLPSSQLELVRRHLAAGKGLVGIRTASHAFAERGDEPVADGLEAWPEFDREVLGCRYDGHFGNHGDDGDKTLVQVVEAASDHPILAGVDAREFVVPSWLYKSAPLAPAAKPLMTGRVDGVNNSHQPVAWTFAYGKSRIFYTSLGHPGDFEIESFARLLENGIRWAAASPSP